MDKASNPFLNSEWINLQKQYIDALSSFKPEQPTADNYGGNHQAWKEALDYWWKSAGKLLPDNSRSVFESVLGQGSAFYAFADQFAVILQEISASDKASNDWQAIMANHLDKMKSGLDSYNASMMDPAHASAFAWPQPLESWKQVMAAMAIVPEEVFEYLEKSSEDNVFASLAAVPGIGFTREFQDKLLEAGRLWKIYQQCHREYSSAFTELSKLALDRLGEKIVECARSGKKIRSLKEVYNLWIDASEEVFAEFAFNEDYSLLYGKLVNSLMAFKRHNDSIVDDFLPLLNLPSRQSMQTVYKRQQQMRNELRNATEIQQAIENSLQQLRSDMQALQGRLTPDKPAVPGKRKRNRKDRNAGT